MHQLAQRLLFVLAGSSTDELRHQIQFLKAQNEMLRSRFRKQIRLTPGERSRLLKLGRPLGKAIRDLITIVSPTTFFRWLRQESGAIAKVRPRKPGRPRTSQDIRQLILRIASETDWGYTRVLGELKKLGINTVSRSTVANILREHGFDPGPQRGEGTWDEFLTMHAKTLWACDFLPRRVLTWRGWRDAYVLVFINILSRRSWASVSTLHPTRIWTAQQTMQFCEAHSNDPNEPTMVLHDRDSKFFGDFRTALRERSVTPVAIQHCSPNMNAYAERFIQTVQKECLNHFVPMGTKHLDHLMNEYLQHYNTERPHQSCDNQPLMNRGSPVKYPQQNGIVIHHDRLGGLLKHYVRRAA